MPFNPTKYQTSLNFKFCIILLPSWLYKSLACNFSLQCTNQKYLSLSSEQSYICVLGYWFRFFLWFYFLELFRQCGIFWFLELVRQCGIFWFFILFYPICPLLLLCFPISTTDLSFYPEGDGQNPIKKFNPATFLQLFNSKIWISNLICNGLFCVEWLEVWGDCLFC